MNEYFEVIRGGINSTFQDEGRNNFYHIGLPFSGAMDIRNFKIFKKDKKEISGKCYETIEIDNGDIIDIISTNKSVYGYFTVNGGFKINRVWGSYSTTVRAEVGPNKGNKLLNGQNINLNKSNVIQSRSLNFVNSKIEFIRVIKGTNFEFFSDQS